jgi:hypothetical protein
VTGVLCVVDGAAPAEHPARIARNARPHTSRQTPLGRFDSGKDVEGVLVVWCRWGVPVRMEVGKADSGLIGRIVEQASLERLSDVRCLCATGSWR